jgi:Xaa-Pro aminopeptidase
MARIGFESSALTDAPAATRLDEVRAWMARHDLDAAYITRPVSIAYLTGVRADPYERLMGLAIRQDKATLILPAIERENGSGRTPTPTSFRGATVRTHMSWSARR